MNRTSLVSLASVLVLLCSGLVLTNCCSDESDAYTYGTDDMPATSLEFTIPANQTFSKVAYPGANIEIVFDYTTYAIGRIEIASLAGGSNGLVTDGVRNVAGHITGGVKITVWDWRYTETNVSYIYLPGFSANETLYTTQNYSYVPPVSGITGYTSVSMVSGSLPTGMSIDSHGTIKGTPTEKGDYYYTLQGTMASGSTVTKGPIHIHLTVKIPTTTTAVKASATKCVEGQKITLTITGTVEDGTAYHATVTTSGGVLSSDSAVNKGVVTLTCPKVDDLTTVTVTVTCDVPGAKVTTKNAIISVVQELTMFAPAMGTLTSH